MRKIHRGFSSCLCRIGQIAERSPARYALERNCHHHAVSRHVDEEPALGKLKNLPGLIKVSHGTDNRLFRRVKTVGRQLLARRRAAAKLRQNHAGSGGLINIR